MKSKIKLLLPLLLCMAIIPEKNLFGQSHKLWLSGGQNLSNTRNADAEKKIGPQNAGTLHVKWVFETSGDVSATPTVDEGGRVRNKNHDSQSNKNRISIY